jgi:hypothetical protein
LADVREDILDFNCNRFVIESECLGILQTISRYGAFLRYIEARTISRFQMAREQGIREAEELASWIFGRISEAEWRLNENLAAEVVLRDRGYPIVTSTSPSGVCIERFNDAGKGMPRSCLGSCVC